MAGPWTLTTQHATSSHGLPMLVRGSAVRSPGDVGRAVVVVWDPEAYARAEAAGFAVALNTAEAAKLLDTLNHRGG